VDLKIVVMYLVSVQTLMIIDALTDIVARKNVEIKNAETMDAEILMVVDFAKMEKTA
jgi:hypothetical protein